MKKQFYSQKLSLITSEISYNAKFKSWLIAFMTLIISLLSLNSSAQTISNVGISTAAACPGSKISISFTVTNGNGIPNHFTSSTHYTIFLSNSSGTGFTPVYTSTSTTFPSGDGISAIVTFSNLSTPSTLPLGTGYKISIASDFPNISVNTGANVSAPITVGPNPTATFNKVFASSCHGGKDGSISVTANGGTSPYAYSWTGVGGFTANTAAIVNLSLGDYNVIVTDNNLCSVSLTGITIKQAPAVSVGISKTSPTCAGNNGVITAFRIGGVYDGVNPIQYKVDGDATIPYQNSGVFSSLSAGNYIVTAKDSKGCTGAQLVNLPSDTRPAPTVGISQKILPSCGNNNGSISALRIGGVSDGTNPIQYKLDGDATVPYQNSNVFSGLAPGNYFVTIKDSRGCTGASEVSLPEDSQPAPSVGYKPTNPGCAFNDGNISSFRIGGVSDGIIPIQFKLDGDATVPYQANSIFNGLSAGSYTVTVKDSRGCTGVSPSIVLSQVPLVFTSNGYNINVSSCGDGSDGAIVVTVSGGVTPYTYTLNGGVQQGVSSLQTFGFGGLLPNVQYNITVTDSKGCSISKSVTLSQASTPATIIAYRGDVTCIGGNDGFMTIGYFAGGVPGYMYSSDGGTTYQDSYRFLNLVAGTYNVVVKDSKGCTSAPVPVTIADGTVACMQGRIGGNTSNNNSNRVGSAVEINPLSKTALSTSLSIQAYPNPSAPSSDFTLDVHGNSTDRVMIFVTDILGRRCYQAQGNANQQYKLGNNFKSGIYFVQVLQGDNVQTIKIVKE